jgi:hypothetical protein
MNPIVDDVHHWRRMKGGSRFQFFATDAEIQEWLETSLIEQYAPYSIVGCDVVKSDTRWKAYNRVVFVCDPADFIACQRATSPPRSIFFLCSLSLTPDIDSILVRAEETQFALNGFVQLIQGHRLRDGRLDESSLAVNASVMNVSTGEERRYPEYVRVFQALRRAIRKALVYSSVYTFPDGSEIEDIRKVKMTAGVFHNYQIGERYLRRPGRYIGQR